MSLIRKRFTAANSASRPCSSGGPTKFALATLLTLVFVAGVAAQTRDARGAGQSESESDATLTNVAIIKLARAKFSDKMIVAIIRTRPAKFDLSPERLIELKKNGVSERVILAMLERGGASQLADAQLTRDSDDDAFFDGLDNSRRKPDANAQTGRNNPNETDIFGSSGGASGETRTNGMAGGASGATQTTGSATVHIIRPQEQSGAPAKLERTPTLNNHSIIDLVEAGFSEGTIIRRIENSPAEFDLSAAKLAELRKRRVTEPIINAMRAAMAGDAPASSMTPRPEL
ncbi:MAG: hypothetical protein QOE33_1519 [Acidobacteriota bacterium]|nr:hypothetical protein [Acidobacteriota bacterium]